MKLTKGKITKLYNKKNQSVKKKKNRKSKVFNKNKTFRGNKSVNLAKKSLRRFKYKRGGANPSDASNGEASYNFSNNGL